MYLFALLLFPCAFAYYAGGRSAVVRPRLLIALAALVLAGLIAVFRGFFLFRAPYDGARPLFFFIEAFCSCALVPCAAYALCMLCARDPAETKIGSFALFMLPFYAVYLPAEIFANPVPLPFFLLFAKPVLYVLMVAAVAHELSGLPARKGRALAVALCAAVVEVAAPSLVETLWYYAFPGVVQGLAAAGFAVLVAVRTGLLSRLTGIASHQK
ncbi:MAG: hypothetical protein K2J50_08100 [Treponemataceae bacterium]|nr:hypothetical protein [Treponemataceae bacterium]